jgi:hypothetical protein
VGINNYLKDSVMQRPKYYEDIKKTRSRQTIPDQITIISAGRGNVPMSPMMRGESSNMSPTTSDSNNSNYTGSGYDEVVQPLKRTGDVHEGEYVIDAETTQAIDPQVLSALVDKARTGNLDNNALRRIVGMDERQGFATGGYNSGNSSANLWGGSAIKKPIGSTGLWGPETEGDIKKLPIFGDDGRPEIPSPIPKPTIPRGTPVTFNGIYGNNDPLKLQTTTNNQTMNYPTEAPKWFLEQANPTRIGSIPSQIQETIKGTEMKFAPVQPITSTVDNRASQTGALPILTAPFVDPIKINPATATQPAAVTQTTAAPGSVPGNYKNAINTSLNQLSDIASGNSQALKNISDSSLRKYDTNAAVNQQVNDMNLAMRGDTLPSGTADALSTQNRSANRSGRSELSGNLAANAQAQALNATGQVANIAAGQQTYDANQKQTERANSLENGNAMLKAGNIAGAAAEYAKAGITVDPTFLADSNNYDKFTQGMDLLTKLQATPGMDAAGAMSAMKAAGLSDIVIQALQGTEPEWTGNAADDPRAKIRGNQPLSNSDAHWMYDNGYDLSTGKRSAMSGFLSYFNNAKTQSNPYNKIYQTITQSERFKALPDDQKAKYLTVLDQLILGDYLKMSIDPNSGDINFDVTNPAPADTGKKFDGTDYNVGDVFVGGDGKLYKKGITTNTPVSDISTVTAKDLAGQSQSDKAVQTILYQMPENDIDDLKSNYSSYASSGKLLKIKDSTGAGGYVLATAIPGGEPGFKSIGNNTVQSQMSFQTIDGKKFSIAYPS